MHHLTNYQLQVPASQEEDDQEIKAYLKQIQQIRNRLSGYQHSIQQERSKKVLLDQLLGQQSFSSPSHTEQQDRSSISSGFIHEQFSQIKEYMNKNIINHKQDRSHENSKENQRSVNDNRGQRYQEQERIKNLVKTTMFNRTIMYKPKYFQRGIVKQQKIIKRNEQETKKNGQQQIDKTLSNWKRPKIFTDIRKSTHMKYPTDNLVKQRQRIRQQLINERQKEQNNQKQKDFYQMKYKNLYNKFEQFERISKKQISLTNRQNLNLNNNRQQNLIIDNQQKKHQFCSKFFSNQRKIYNNLLRKTKREQKKCGALIQNIRNFEVYERIRVLAHNR